MNLLTSLFENPAQTIPVIIGLILAIGIHEFAHAYAADKLGDPTPRMQGRLTLNPIAHLDLIGSLLILIAGIGWGKPVQFNPSYLKNPRRDAAIVAFAGPLSNIIIALVSVGAIAIYPNMGVIETLVPFITLNVALAIFNLIPVEPLDGFKIVGGLLPPHLAYQWEDTRKYGLYVLLFLFITGAVNRIVFPAVNFVTIFLLQGLI